MRRVLAVAALAEAATGAALLVVPSRVARLLLGEDLGGAALPVARVAGIALIALGFACWPGSPRIGMLLYSAGVPVFLAYVGLAGGAGALLWPEIRGSRRHMARTRFSTRSCLHLDVRARANEAAYAHTVEHRS